MVAVIRCVITLLAEAPTGVPAMTEPLAPLGLVRELQ
jgi:hypothetical protein